MNHIFPKFWWILAARGALGILLGTFSILWIFDINQQKMDLFGAALFLKQASLVANLIFLIGGYALVDGIFTFLLGAQNYGEGRRWRSLMVEGILGVGLGIFTLFNPAISAVALLSWIAAWALATGFLEMAQSRDLNEYKDRKGPLFFAGLTSMVFGVLVLTFRVGGMELIWSLAAYSFLFGLSLLVLGLRLRHFAGKNKG